MATDGEALTREDRRYEALFDIRREVTNRGHTAVDDLYEGLAALRSKGAVQPVSVFMALTGQENPVFDRARPHWTTLTFEASSAALMDNSTYSSLMYHEMPGVMTSIGHTILTMVGNEHARYRSSVQPMVTRQQAMGWWKEKWIDPFVDVLVGELERGTTADLTLQLCARLPMHAVTAAYGLSSDKALEFRDSLLKSLNASVPSVDRAAASATVRHVLLSAIQERRRDRQDDLISRMIDAPFTGPDGAASALSDEDILSFSRLLLLAGGGTTFRQLGITLFALLSNPCQLEDLRQDRSLMGRAFDEALRWHCTDPVFYRLATKDSVLGGREVPEGSIIDVCLAAGNHDPERWEAPQRYDLHRTPKRHLGFAAGPHSCLGRFVAEAEMASMTNALLDRLPKLRLDDRAPPPRIVGGMQTRGMDHLRVRFD